jgi:hypothetical protein
VRFRIQQPITDYPDNKETDRDQTKRVALKKATFAAARHKRIFEKVASFGKASISARGYDVTSRRATGSFILRKLSSADEWE